MEKYFYVRCNSTLAEDDDEANGSSIMKVSDMIAMGSLSDTTLIMKFKPRRNAFSGGEGVNIDYRTDSITLTVATNNQKAVMEAILAEVAKPQIGGAPYLITLFDAVLGTTDIKGVTGSLLAISANQA